MVMPDRMRSRPNGPMALGYEFWQHGKRLAFAVAAAASNLLRSRFGADWELPAVQSC